MSDATSRQPTGRRRPLYDNPSYPEWPAAAVGVAFLPTWAVGRLSAEGAWSPPAQWSATPLTRVENEVRTALRAETQHCHAERGLLLVAHRLLAGVDLCDLPPRHAADCDSLHVPPGWTAAVLRVPPARLLFIGADPAEGDPTAEIADRSRDPYLTIWPAAPYFVVDHLLAGDLTPLVQGPPADNRAAVAGWWANWPVILTTLLASPAVPGPAGHLFGDAAIPPPPPPYLWPSPTRITAAARSLRAWVQSQDIWYDQHDRRPFPSGPPEALVAAAVAWALRGAVCFAAFPDDISAILTEADLSVDYDFIPVDVALRAAADGGGYRAAVDAAWASGDPEQVAANLTRFACGLLHLVSEHDTVALRAVASEWSVEVYHLEALDACVADRLHDDW